MAYNIPASPAYKVNGLAHEWRASDVTTGGTTWRDRQGGVVATISGDTLTLDTTGISVTAYYVRKTTAAGIARNTSTTSGYVLSPASGQTALYVANVDNCLNTNYSVAVGNPAGIFAKLHTGSGGGAQRVQIDGSNYLNCPVNETEPWIGTVAMLFDFANGTGTTWSYLPSGAQSLKASATLIGSISTFALDAQQDVDFNFIDDGAGSQDGIACFAMYYWDTPPTEAEIETGLAWMAANPTSGAYDFG